MGARYELYSNFRFLNDTLFTITMTVKMCRMAESLIYREFDVGKYMLDM